jgi:hypothetical protein
MRVLTNLGKGFTSSPPEEHLIGGSARPHATAMPSTGAKGEPEEPEPWT